MKETVWERDGLLQRVIELKEQGKRYHTVATEVSNQFHIELTAEAIRKKLSREHPSRGVKRDASLDTVERIARATSNAKGKGLRPEGRHFDDHRNRTRYNPVRVAVLDIEATGLNAMFGRILCAALLFNDETEPRVFRGDAYPTWKNKRSDDSMLVGDILTAMEDADVVIAHNGLNYDLPMLRTRALAYSMAPVHPKKLIDPVWQARKALRLPSNSLAKVAEHLGVEMQKTAVAAEFWVKAGMDGDKEAMDYIVDHNIKDVYILEEVAWRLRKYVRVIDNLGSWR